MSEMPRLFRNFGPELERLVKKMGDRTEADRPKGDVWNI